MKLTQKVVLFVACIVIVLCKVEAISKKAEPPVELRCEDHDIQRTMVWEPQRSWMRKAINYTIQYRRIICQKCRYKKLPCFDEKRNENVVNLTRPVCVVPSSQLQLENYYEFRVKAFYQNHGMDKIKTTRFAHVKCFPIFRNTTYSSPLSEITSSPSSLIVNLTLPQALQAKRELLEKYGYTIRYYFCVDKTSRLGGKCSRKTFQRSTCKKADLPRYVFDHNVESSSKYCIVTWFTVDNRGESNFTADVIVVPKKPLSTTERLILIASLITCIFVLVGLMLLAWIVKERWRQMSMMLKKKIPDYLVEMKMDYLYDETKKSDSSYRLRQWELLQMKRWEEMYEGHTSFVDDVETTSCLFQSHLLKVAESDVASEPIKGTEETMELISVRNLASH